ncbi:MAG: PAS domain S-box protein [Gammaproteobacteria bacterium]|nr:PAS domain S-box protein [Gammaproteobacteria bacterium]
MLLNMLAALRASDGGRYGEFGNSMPTEQLKQARRQLVVSEERFRALVESTSDWVWEVDVDGRYTYSSPRVNDVLGFTSQEILGRSYLDFMSPDEADRIDGLFGYITCGKEPFVQLRKTCLHRDGREVILESSGVPITDPDGELIGYRGIDRDITHRIRMEARLRESEEIFGHFAGNAREAFWVKDLEQDKVIYISPAYETIWRDPVENVYQESTRALRFVHPDDLDRVLAAMQEASRGGTDLEYRIVLRGGEVRWIHARSFPVANSAGEIYRCAGTAEDITDRKLAEESRLRHERLQRDTLVREVHHRIKNNLQGIVGLLRQQLGAYHEFDDVLKKLVGQIMSISLIHGLQGSSESVQLQDIVRAIGSSIEDVFGDAVEIEMQLDSSRPHILVEEDAVPIALIVNELLTNAAKHGLRGQTIRLSLKDEGANTRIQVSNRLAEHTSQSSLNQQINEGLGIGLMRSLMPKRGAQLDFSSEKDGFSAMLTLDVTSRSQ